METKGASSALAGSSAVSRRGAAISSVVRSVTVRLIILAVGDRSISEGAARHRIATAFQDDFISDDMALCKLENAAGEWCSVRGIRKLSRAA
ncbi:hypothetical protein [Mesorhizobium sp.]|uniref:hypothetical protein n=1 Tax=Mesorhizobium sp. TaxID=1871066 RepID=UPI00257D5922|nr:hypothetical protein [Mesorhizobium sp.]